jgi:hypothetical protein
MVGRESISMCSGRVLSSYLVVTTGSSIRAETCYPAEGVIFISNWQQIIHVPLVYCCQHNIIFSRWGCCLGPIFGSSFFLVLLLWALQSMTNLALFHECSPLVPILWLSSPIACFRPAGLIKSVSSIRAFYGVGLPTLHPTPNLEDQGIPLCLDHHLRLVGQGRPYQ